MLTYFFNRSISVEFKKSSPHFSKLSLNEKETCNGNMNLQVFYKYYKKIERNERDRSNTTPSGNGKGVLRNAYA